MNKSIKKSRPGRGSAAKSNGRTVPASYVTVQSSRAPRIQRTARGARVVHSELITTIAGSTTLSVSRYAVNPGMAATFPWLSGQAASWEQYRFNSLKFQYVNRLGTTTAGSVIYSPEYDPSDLTPTTEQQLTNTRDAKESNVFVNFECPLDPKAMHAIGPRKFVRSGNIPGDLKTYDVAAFFVGTVGEADTTEIGKLWVSYDVEFFVPQDSPNKDTGPSTVSAWKLSADQTLTTGAGAVVEFDSQMYDPLAIGSPSTGVFTPPSGTYLVSAILGIADSAAENFAATLDLRKNSAVLSNRAAASIASESSAGQSLQIIAEGILTCNGSDTVDAYLTLTGAAGTLKADSPYCQIFFKTI